MTNIENELALLDAVGQLASAAQARWKCTASGFRPFALFDPKEVVQTRIIAALLDPCANHGQGEDFLRLFLEAVGEDSSLPNSLTSTEIATEVLTKSIDWDRRRIDLLIRLPHGRLIALESKACNAVNQRNQIEHYLEHLENIAPKNNLLVYLTPKVGRPADVTHETWKLWTEGNPKRVRCRKYDDLIGAWLVKCHARCSSEARPLLDFLNDFRRFTGSEVERSYLMGSSFTEDIANSIMQSRERLTASAAITNSRNAVRRELARRFFDSLEKQLRSRLNEAWLIKRVGGDGWPQLTLQRSNGKKIRAAFEIGWEINFPLSEWTIGLGISGGGNDAPLEDKPSTQLLGEVQKALPGGHSTDAWAWFSREFENKSIDVVDRILYDKPKEKLQGLADLLIRIADLISVSANATHAGQSGGG